MTTIFTIIAIFAAFYSGFYFAHKRDDKPIPELFIPMPKFIIKDRKERIDLDEEKKNDFFS